MTVKQVVDFVEKAAELSNPELAVESLIKETVRDAEDLIERTVEDVKDAAYRYTAPKQNQKPGQMAKRGKRRSIGKALAAVEKKTQMGEVAALRKVVSDMRRQKSVTAPVAISVPNRKTFYSAKATSNGKVAKQVVTCGDRLGRIKTTATTHESEVLFSQNLNPSRFYDTPLAIESLLWDKFHLDDITFWYDPDCSTNNQGSIIGAFDPDIKDEGSYEVGTDINLRVFCAHDVMKQTSIWRPESWTWKNPDPTFLFTQETGNGEEYWNIPGVFAIVSNTDYSSQVPLGTIYYKAKYTFEGRNVEAAVLQSGYYQTDATAATSSNPFLTATIEPATAVGKQSTLGLPTLGGAGDTVRWTNLNPTVNYWITLRWTSGTNATASPSTTASVGTRNTNASYQYHANGGANGMSSVMVTPNNNGVIELTTTSGTWTNSPQHCDIRIVSTGVSNNTNATF